MGENREARALGASESIEVGDKEFRLSPIVIKRLSELENDALRHYKRSYLETFKDNLDLLDEGQGNSLMMTKMEEIAQWDVSNLPSKVAHDVTRVPISKKLKKWIGEEYGECPDSDGACLAVLSVALDTDKIDAKKVKELTGVFPIMGRIRFDQWWVTSSTVGMIAFVFNSVRVEHPETTKEDIGNWPFSKIAEAAKSVERLTVAMMGNG